MTPPGSVATQPRDLCVEPYEDVRGCVRETVEAAGMAWALPIWECIITHESGWDRWAIGGAGERGLTQIHPVHFGWVDEDRLWEPDYNLQIAITLWRASGWKPWTTRYKCGLG